jgi:hypothetical protein
MTQQDQDRLAGLLPRPRSLTGRMAIPASLGECFFSGRRGVLQ